MPTMDNGARTNTPPDLRHLVCSSGGSRAILGSAGAIVALDHAGLKDFDSIGGISGGSVPTALFAGGRSAQDTLKLAIEIDFSSKLSRHASFLRVLFAYFMKGRFEKTRPRKGVLSSEKLGTYIDNMIPTWPKGYWTMAVVGENQILFTDHGVFEITASGQVTTLSSKPAPLGLAVRASCAVPGIISAVPYRGRYLFDGALSPDGACPTNVAEKHLGAPASQIVAVDVGTEDGTSDRIVRLWSILCGSNCVQHDSQRVVTEDDVAVLIKPAANNFKSLQFTLTRDQKWQAVMAGYIATVGELKRACLIDGKQLRRMEHICRAFQRIERMCTFAAEGHLTRLTEQLLSRHGLY